MPAFSSCNAPAWARPSARAVSVVYSLTGRTLSGGGAAKAGAPARARATRRAATAIGLPLKNLLLGDGDRLAPPGLGPGQRNVVPRHPWPRPLAVAEREAQVLVRREVRPVLVPRAPFLTGGATRCSHENGGDEQELPADVAHI